MKLLRLKSVNYPSLILGCLVLIFLARSEIEYKAQEPSYSEANQVLTTTIAEDPIAAWQKAAISGYSSSEELYSDSVVEAIDSKDNPILRFYHYSSLFGKPESPRLIIMESGDVTVATSRNRGVPCHFRIERAGILRLISAIGATRILSANPSTAERAKKKAKDIVVSDPDITELAISFKLWPQSAPERSVSVRFSQKFAGIEIHARLAEHQTHQAALEVLLVLEKFISDTYHKCN